jgi:hypothetical protein
MWQALFEEILKIFLYRFLCCFYYWKEKVWQEYGVDPQYIALQFLAFLLTTRTAKNNTSNIFQVETEWDDVKTRNLSIDRKSENNFLNNVPVPRFLKKRIVYVKFLKLLLYFHISLREDITNVVVTDFRTQQIVENKWVSPFFTVHKIQGWVSGDQIDPYLTFVDQNLQRSSLLILCTCDTVLFCVWTSIINAKCCSVVGATFFMRFTIRKQLKWL